MHLIVPDSTVDYTEQRDNMNPEAFMKIMALYQIIEEMNFGDEITFVKRESPNDERVGIVDRDLAYEYQMDRVKEAYDT